MLKKEKNDFVNRVKRILEVRKRLPCLTYIETHLVNHCNLKCVSCTHYSTIADKYFVDVNEFENSIKILSTKLRFKHIRLLGGEPLLHPDITKLIKITRKYFGKSNIYIVTNGTLLPTMSESFWDTCRKNNIVIHISKYPINENKIESYTNLIKKHRAKLGGISDSQWFVLHNQLGNSDKNFAFINCIMSGPNVHFKCINLRNNRIYVCPKTAYIDLYNKKYNLRIPQDKGIDISKHNGKKIIKKVYKSTTTCKYCTYAARSVYYKESEAKWDDWNVFNKKEDVNNFQESHFKYLKQKHGHYRI